MENEVSIFADRQTSGVVFLTLDCYEHRVGYYERFGFQRNLYQPVVLDYDSPRFELEIRAKGL